jgi:L-lactate dehydrogenase (cytochrome)
MIIASCNDFRSAAQRRLPRFLFDYLDGGAVRETTPGRPHSLGNLAKVLLGRNGLDDYMGWLAANFDPAISWADLDWLRQSWDGPLIIKGILNPQDARSAVRLGADGVVVSNHGGRQLDGALSSARAVSC